MQNIGLQPFVNGLVHETARDDGLALIRHRAFILSHLAVGLVSVALLPIMLVVLGAPGGHDILALAWLTAPLFIALYLSRTGAFAVAHLAAATSFIGLVTYVAWMTGGLSSVAIGWLLLPQIEAALSGKRSIVVGTVVLALVAITFLAFSAHLTASASDALHLGSWVLVAGAASSIIYTGGIALGLDALLIEARESAQHEEVRYRLMAENASDLITRHSRNGNVLFASPAAQSLTGEPVSHLARDGMFQRVHVLDRPAFLRAFAEAVASGKPQTVEFRLRQLDAQAGAIGWTWVEMNCRPLNALEHDGTIELIAVTRDINQRKAQELVLARANEETARANAAKTRFLANVSHELRTPLNAIIGFSEMITYDTENRFGIDRYREYAGLINDSGKHLLDVVNSILDMSKIDSGSFEIVTEPFDVTPLVRNCADLMRPAADKGSVTIVTDAPAIAPELCADRRACKQIYLNLISNAVKFSKAGGQVTVGVRFETDTAVLFVTDTGIGIAQKDVELLGTPFVQADNNRGRKFEGTGLGLSLVKGLTSLHGGTLEIRSKPGEGTTVMVRLPLTHHDDKITTLPRANAPETQSTFEFESTSRNVRSA